MPIPWESLLLSSLLVMTIPIAALIGQRWRRGPLISLSAGAMLGTIIYLTLTWSSFSVDYYPVYPNSTVKTLSLVGGAVLLLGALALTLTDALRERRRGWALIQCALVYGSFVGMLGFLAAPARFCGELPSGTYCAPPDLGRFNLFGALSLAGPFALLVYALRAGVSRQPRALPEALTISRLPSEER